MEHIDSESGERKPEPWRAAYAYIAESLPHVTRYETRTLYALCGLEYEPTQRPGEPAKSFRCRFEGTRRQFAQFMREVKIAVGDTLRVDIRPTGRGAYEAVPHDRHVSTAERDTMKRVRYELSEGQRRLSSFDLSRADDGQRKHHSDAVARLDAVEHMTRSRRRRAR